jgi:hypothetical protein
MAGELHSEVTSEPIRALHDDGADAVAGNAIQHRNEAWTRCDCIGALDALRPCRWCLEEEAVTASAPLTRYGPAGGVWKRKASR